MGIHAVRNNRTGLTGLLFWNEAGGAFEGLSVDAQACILMKQTEDGLQLAASDPTKEDHVIRIQLDRAVKEAVAHDEGIQIISLSPLTLRVDMTGQDGQSMNLTVYLD